MVNAVTPQVRAKRMIAMDQLIEKEISSTGKSNHAGVLGNVVSVLLQRSDTSQSVTPPTVVVTVEVFDIEGNKTVESVQQKTELAGAVCRYNPKNREAARRKMELATAKKSLAVRTWDPFHSKSK